MLNYVDKKLIIKNKSNANDLKQFFTNLSKQTYYNFNTFGVINYNNIDKIIKYEIIRKDKIKFFSFINDELIGYSFLIKFEKSTKKHNCILGLVIKDKWQNKGYGKKIVKFMIDLAWKKNYQKIWLTAFADNLSALKIYKDLGFEIEGVFIDDELVKNNKRDIVSMAIFRNNKNSSIERERILTNLQS